MRALRLSASLILLAFLTPHGAFAEAGAPPAQPGGLSITGLLTDATGAPAAETPVSLTRLGPTTSLTAAMGPEFYLRLRRATWMDDPLARHQSARTGADGRFSFEGLEPGVYELYAGVSPRLTPLEVIYLDEKAPAKRLELALVEPITLTGEVLGPDGAPRAGVPVEVLQPGDHRARTVTGAGGGFRLLVSPEHPVQVRATDPAWVSSLHAGRGDEPKARLTLHAPRVLAGRVTSRGRPVAGAVVQAEWLGVEAVTTGADGAFRFPRLPAVALRVQAKKGAASVIETVDLGGDSKLEQVLVLVPPPPVEVEVRGEDGAPMAGVEVKLRGSGFGSGKAPIATTDAQGRVRFEDPPETGMDVRTAEATAKGYVPAAANVWVRSPEQKAVLTLRKGAPVRIPVQLPAVMPQTPCAPQVTLVRLREAGEPDAKRNRYERFDAPVEGGAAHFPALPPGRYLAWVTPEPLFTPLSPFEVPGEPAALRAVAGGTIRGRVVDAAGAPAVGVRVVTWEKPEWDPEPRHPSWRREGTTDSTGAFVVEGVGPGAWTLMAMGMHLDPLGASVVAEAGDEVVIRLPAAPETKR